MSGYPGKDRHYIAGRIYFAAGDVSLSRTNALSALSCEFVVLVRRQFWFNKVSEQSDQDVLERSLLECLTVSLGLQISRTGFSSCLSREGAGGLGVRMKTRQFAYPRSVRVSSGDTSQ